MRPLYFTDMKSRLKLFKDCGITDSEKNTNRMRCRETVIMEVLLLPPEMDIWQQKIWTIGANNRLLPREQLIQI